MVSESIRRVDQVTVAVAPPEDDGVNDVVVVLVQELGPGQVLNIVTQVEIDVVVVTELLNQIPIFETQFFRHIYRSGGVGLAHVFLQCLIHAVRIVISITPSQHPLCLRFKLPAPRSAIFCVTSGYRQPACPAAFRHTTSMTAKYNGGAQGAATHRAEVTARVAGDNYACGATALELNADIGVTRTLPGAHDRAVVTDTSHTSRSRRAVTLPGLSAPMNARKERLDVAAGEDTSHILSGLTNQLPDRDPEETAEWVESLDSLIREQGTERAQYIMRSLLQRAGAQSVGVPMVTTTDYVNTIPVDQEAEFPGNEEYERRYRAYMRWNAAVMVHRSQRPNIGVGGHISTYAGAATLYEVGFNHFFRGKDHPGGGDQVFFQGHASPGMYARAFMEGRLTEEDLDGFRQEKSKRGPRPVLLPAPAADAASSGNSPPCPWASGR